MRGGVIALVMLAGSFARADYGALEKQLDAAVSGGDAWNVAVPKVVAILGQPAVASDDHVEWAAMADGMCLHVTLDATDDGFVHHVDRSGFGPGTDGRAECKKLTTKHAKLPAKLRAPQPIDADAQAATVIAQWGTGQFDAMFAAAHPQFKQGAGSPAALARLAHLFEMRAGKYVKLGAPLDHAFKDQAWVVTAPVVYEKGTLKIAASFALYEGKPMLVDIDVRLPKELQAHADPKEAAHDARAALDRLLAAKTDAFFEHMDRELAQKLSRAEFDPKLADLLKKLGKVQSITQTEQHLCDDKHDRQCFAYDIKTANGTAKATLDMTYFIAEWVVYGFDLEPPQ